VLRTCGRSIILTAVKSLHSRPEKVKGNVDATLEAQECHVRTVITAANAVSELLSSLSTQAVASAPARATSPPKETRARKLTLMMEKLCLSSRFFSVDTLNLLSSPFDRIRRAAYKLIASLLQYVPSLFQDVDVGVCGVDVKWERRGEVSISAKQKKKKEKHNSDAVEKEDRRKKSGKGQREPIVTEGQGRAKASSSSSAQLNCLRDALWRCFAEDSPGWYW
jgi:hypothetical protein